MRVRAETTGFDRFAARLLAVAAGAPGAVHSGLSESVDRLQALTEVNSSGRPGPNIVTGSYHGSWFTAVGGNEAVLSNRQPQALRLEFGFVGVDSLGRHYAQPPYAHLGPAVEEFRDEFGDIMTRALRL